MIEQSQSDTTLPLVARVTCPHCWSQFPPEDILWIAEHSDLMGSPRLGSDHTQRFLPTRFTVDGAALDARGVACYRLACPKCHLELPRALLEMPPEFISVLGGPSCGKSYLLAAMVWRARSVMLKSLKLSFDDADPALNQRVSEYVASQFLNPNRDQVVALAKTEEQGDLYNTVQYGDENVTYPRPFMFTVRPTAEPPKGKSGGRVLCVYDNAGESFLPGQDVAARPVTRHLARSSAMLFCFDPTQDTRFRRACRGRTEDPQMAERQGLLDREHPTSQTAILSEAANRVRRYVGLSHNERHKRPLFVIVTKFDSWARLLKHPNLPRPLVQTDLLPMAALDVDVIGRISATVRELLWRLCPEVVSVAEGFAKQVTYIPVSATGCAPEVDAQTGALGFRPHRVKPIWAEVPLICAMAQWTRLVEKVERRKPRPHLAALGETNGNHDRQEPDSPAAEAS